MERNTKNGLTALAAAVLSLAPVSEKAAAYDFRASSPGVNYVEKGKERTAEQKANSYIALAGALLAITGLAYWETRRRHD